MSDATEAAYKAAPAAETAATDSPRKTLDEFDPLGWIVPVICKDCDKRFEVPYRHFQAGVVFHCPHCHGSYVPKSTMDRVVRETFETFYAKRKHARDEFTSVGGDAEAFHRRQEKELAEFRDKLEQLARAMCPAGKMVKRRGLAAMFS
jgi:hypothetical protein